VNLNPYVGVYPLKSPTGKAFKLRRPIMSARETHDLFYFIKAKRLGFFMRDKKYKSQYFWHDTFAIRWRRKFGCKHEFAKIDRFGGASKFDTYCFKCERYEEDVLKEKWKKGTLTEEESIRLVTKQL